MLLGKNLQAFIKYVVKLYYLTYQAGGLDLMLASSLILISLLLYRWSSMSINDLHNLPLIVVGNTNID